MNAAEFAIALDGLTTGFGNALKVKDRKELEALAKFFRRFRDQPLTNVIDFGEEMLQKERGSLLVITERIRTLRSDNPAEDDTPEEIWKDTTKLKSKDLTKLLKSFDKSTEGKMSEKLERVQTELLSLINGEIPDETGSSEGLADRVEALVKEYRTIEREIHRFDFSEIRERLERFKSEPKAVLETVVNKLGFSYSGSRDQLVNKLLGELEFIKRTENQTDMM